MELKITQMRMYHLSKGEVGRFYYEHQDKGFFERLKRFTTSGPLIAMELEHEEAVDRWRRLMGNTYPEKADPFTLRAKYGTKSIWWDRWNSNAVHGSDSEENAKNEINFFFGSNPTTV